MSRKQSDPQDLISTEVHQRIIKTAFVELYKTSNDLAVKKRIEFLLHYDRRMSLQILADDVIFDKCVEISRKYKKAWDLPYVLTNDPETRKKYCGKVAAKNLKQSIIDELEQAGYFLPPEIEEYNRIKAETKKH